MKLRVWIHTNKVGSKCDDEIEIDDEDVEGLDAIQRDRLYETIFDDWRAGICEWGWEESK
jgi:hypothetical protein